MKTYYYTYQSPLGTMTMGSDGEALIGLWFNGSKYFGSTLTDNKEEKYLSVFEETTLWLDQYFSGRIPSFMPKLSLRGSAFRLSVWEILMEISYGKVMTYGEIAKKIAKERGWKTMSAQAVGGAVGHNPIGILIPCHRVIGSKGNLIGYAGGLEKKVYLLKLEGILL